MRALFVTGSLVHGGAERHSITLMNRLAEQGCECHAVYVKNDPSQLGRIRLRGQGSVKCLEAARYLDLAALRAFTEHLIRLRPSVVIAANAYALMYAALALGWARLRGGPRAALLVTWHSTRMMSLKESLQMLLYRLFFRSADCAVFVSERQRRYWRQRLLSSRRDEVIHNGVDLDRFHPIGDEEEPAGIRGPVGTEDVRHRAVAQRNLPHELLGGFVEEAEPVGPHADDQHPRLGGGKNVVGRG